MSRSVAAALSPAIVAIVACASPGDAPAPAAATSGTPVSGGFQEPEDYAFAVTSSCGERAFIGDYRVVVADGEVVDETCYVITDYRPGG